MINLIRNELIKISKKKSIYITLLVTLVFVIITNVIYNIEPDYSDNYESQISYYEEQIKQLDPNKPEERDIYISYKTEIEIGKLAQKYAEQENNWQSQILYQQGYDLLSDLNRSQYVDKDEEEYTILKRQYDSLIERLDSNDWKYFANENLKDVENSLKEQKELLSKTINKADIKEIEEQIERLEVQKQVLQWRLEKDICYGDGYFNQCLHTYERAKQEIRDYEKNVAENGEGQVEYANKRNYYDSLENAAISKYDIEKGTTVGDGSTPKNILLDVFSEFEIFIIIMSVMIAGTIVSEEFNKGTVKLLLIKPYKRVTILTAKFITTLIMLMIIILLVMLMQFVVGGVVQGFDSFSEPTLVYNHTTNQLEEMSIMKYLAIETLGKLPIYVLLMTLAFAFSTIFTNSALSIAISLLGSMGAPMINMLAMEFKLTWIKFFVTPNWDLTQYFFGGLPEFEGLTMGFSIAIITIYMLIMLVPTYVIFKKKNIKNI